MFLVAPGIQPHRIACLCICASKVSPILLAHLYTGKADHSIAHVGRRYDANPRGLVVKRPRRSEAGRPPHVTACGALGCSSRSEDSGTRRPSHRYYMRVGFGRCKVQKPEFRALFEKSIINLLTLFLNNGNPTGSSLCHAASANSNILLTPPKRRCYSPV